MSVLSTFSEWAARLLGQPRPPAVAVLIVAATVSAIPLSAHADDEGLIDYSLSRQDGHLYAWLDLSGLVTSALVNKMQDGVEFAFTCRVSVLRPRRLWGAVTTANSTTSFNLAYGIVTEDYHVSYQTTADEPERRFSSLARLHQFLADSIAARIVSIDSLKSDDRYFIRVHISRLSITALRLLPGDTPADKSSPVRYLFDKFLQYTGFGRKEYSVTSRLFSLDEIEDRD